MIKDYIIYSYLFAFYLIFFPGLSTPNFSMPNFISMNPSCLRCNISIIFWCPSLLYCISVFWLPNGLRIKISYISPGKDRLISLTILFLLSHVTKNFIFVCYNYHVLSCCLKSDAGRWLMLAYISAHDQFYALWGQNVFEYYLSMVDLTATKEDNKSLQYRNTVAWQPNNIL